MKNISTHKHFKRTICFALATFLAFANVSFIRAASRAKASAEAMPLSFTDNEHLFYEVEFSRAFLRGINVAELRFTAHKTPLKKDVVKEIVNRESEVSSSQLQTSDDAAYNFSCEATSKGWFQKLFNLTFRFSLKSVVEAKNFFVARNIKVDEQGKRTRESETVFDRTQNLLTWTERNPTEPSSEPRIIRASLPRETQDLASVFYFLRMRTLAPNSRFEISLSDSGRIYQVPVKVKSRTRVDSLLGKTEAIELSVELFGANRPFEGDGKISIWFSDDARRLPLKARINTDAGTVDVNLRQVVRDGKVIGE